MRKSVPLNLKCLLRNPIKGYFLGTPGEIFPFFGTKCPQIEFTDCSPNFLHPLIFPGHPQ